MTTTAKRSTTARRGMSNTADQNYPAPSADVLSGVTTVEVVPPSVVKPTRTRKSTTTTTEAPAEVKAPATPKRTPRKAVAKPVYPTLPDNATEADRTVLASMIEGNTGLAVAIAAGIKDLSSVKVKGSLMRLVGFGAVTLTHSTTTLGGRSRDVDLFFVTGHVPAPEDTDAAVLKGAVKAVSAPAKAVPTAADLAKMAKDVQTAKARKGTAPKVEAPRNAPRAPQTRPYVDGAPRTEKVNGLVRVIGTPLNPERHAPGGLQSEIRAFLLASAGTWFKVGTIASSLNRWPAQTGRTSLTLVHQGEFQIDGATYVIEEDRSNVKMYRALLVTPAPKPRASRAKKA